MRTSKPISTISYNSPEFLLDKLDELVSNHRISDYMFIYHYAEVDERKDHIHLWLKPNTLLDTMDLQSFFQEFDPTNPKKPLGCIDFHLTKDVDEWILYNLHFEPYLATKFESREYHYQKSDFRYLDEDTFEDLYVHAFRGSEWARRNQILCALKDNSVDPYSLFMNGTLPLNLASQVNSVMYMRTHYGLDRGGRNNHESVEDET